jgi:bisphosphoglycerate-dependent phosphoglycerate mutase
VIIRHSERPHISSAIGTNDVSLTPQGIAASVRLGHELAKHNKSIRLFHSPVLRCAQTANHIHEGAVQAGVKSHVMGQRNSLGGSYMADSAKALPLADQLGNKFVRTWFDGGIDTTIIKPLRVALAEHINYLVAELQSAEATESLDVHVTHDWNVMLFRDKMIP